MQIAYEVLETCLTGEETGAYRTYGIKCNCYGKIEDISLSRQMVEQLTACFNRLGLSPVHFWDAIEDWLE